MFLRTIRKYDLMSLSMTSQSLCSRAVNFLDTGTGWQRTKKKKNQNYSRTYKSSVGVNSLYPPHRAGWQHDSSVGLKEKGVAQQHSRLPSSTCPSSSPCLPRSARQRGHLLRPTGATETVSGGVTGLGYMLRPKQTNKQKKIYLKSLPNKDALCYMKAHLQSRVRENVR